MRALIEAALAQPASDAAARRLWHDTVGCACSGFRTPELAALVESHRRLSPGAYRPPMVDRSGPPAGTRVGAHVATRVRAPVGTHVGALAGAWLNAVAACWDEACEGLALAHGRPGVPVISALWALCAHQPLPWDALLRATTVGYQVGGTMGAYLRILPGMHVDACWPSIGAAAAAAVALGGDAETVVDAVETCASQLPASLYLPIAQGSVARNTYLGHSAWLGATCALSAAAGIGGPRGAAQSYAARILQRDDRAPIPIFAEPLIERAYWKPYACVRHVQYGARAAALLRERHALHAAQDIEAIRLRTYPEAITYCGNRAPASVIAAQFSLSWGIAAMLSSGDLGPAQYTAASLADPHARRLESLVELIAAPEAWGEHGRGATLEIRAGGRWLVETVTSIEGDAGAPATDEQRHAKFARYCQDDPAILETGERILAAAGDADAAAVLDAR